MEAEERNQHIQQIKNPLRWPRYPFLPMKRPDEKTISPKVGTIIYGMLSTVFDFSVWKLPKTEHNTIKELLEVVEKIAEYSSVEEMIDNGWEVD